MNSNENCSILSLLGATTLAVTYAYQFECSKIVEKRRRHRRMWVREIFLKRRQLGCGDNLIQQMRLSDRELFFNFTRMSVQSFDYLLSLIGPHITKHSHREPISPQNKLAVTLRFLATGDSYPSLSYIFRIAPSTICNIIREVTNVIWEVLSPIYLKPLSVKEWISVKENFYKYWQLPNCLGSIDGKHIVIQAPSNTGSLYYNYKKQFSIVLLGICDAKYFFTYVDIGAYGAQSDGGILKNSTFGKKLKNGTLNIPPPAPLPSTEEAVPMYFVGDEAFPLQINLLRPYSRPRVGKMPEDELIFNYRLSRARRTIENTFGIMVARFRIFHKVITAAPETVDGIVKAVTCLHNFIKSQESGVEMYCNRTFVDREIDGIFIPGEWRKEIPANNALQMPRNLRFGNRNAPREAWTFRDYVKDYVNNIGGTDCPWQFDYIRKTC